MIPRRLPIPANDEIRSRWGARLLAHVHKVDELAETGVWTCGCRCCQWALTRQEDWQGEGLSARSGD